MGNMAKLKHLDLRYTNICEEIVTMIVKECPLLKSLNMRGCDVSLHALQQVATHHMLDDIDVSGVFGGIDDVKSHVVFSMTSLRRLEMSHNGSRMTSASLLLIDQLASLTHLHLGWTRT